MIYMIYVKGCPACLKYNKLIKDYELENVIKPIEFVINDILGDDVKNKFISEEGSNQISIPMFISNNDNKNKVIPRILLEEIIKKIYGKDVFSGLKNMNNK